ncbi:MAG: GTP 3',8-cyclase MoaA [Euryarchaeota archaeon]|nr:GTP 3',8-cyclase MoaA [Euryarchaeota archaeon]
MLRDSFGRPLTSMRISITQRCNFRCRYCHHEGITESAGEEMTPQEIRRVVSLGARFGVRKVKLTGGEPLVRRDVVEIVEEVAGVRGIEDLSMTTNAYYLAELAHELKRAGLDRVNISLDTLRSDVFSWITRGGELERVIAGIEAALEAKLTPVKINMVVMKGVNEDEIHEMLTRFSGRDVVLQLIELVASDEDFFRRYFFDLDAFEEELAKRAVAVHERRFMHGRRQYQLNGARVEVIKPMHNSRFCAHCTRLRVTADGKFKPCLMRSDNLVDFLTPMRRGASDEELERLFPGGGTQEGALLQGGEGWRS